MTTGHSILVPVDGSENSDRAVAFAIELVKGGFATTLHLLNVQPPLGGAVATFIPKESRDSYHREEGEKSLVSAEKLAAAAGVPCEPHISVGRPGVVVAEYCKRLACRQIVIGTRGHTGLGGVLMGSVAQEVVARSSIPVTLVK